MGRPDPRLETPNPVIPKRDSAERRCLCGSLVARHVPGGVELKCRRCKRTLVVPLEPAPNAAGAALVGGS